MRSIRWFASILAVAACALAFSSVAASAASSHKVDISIKAKQTGTKLTGTYSGAPFGRGKMTGTLVIPKATVTFYTKLGDATLAYSGALKGSTVTGRWTWVHGTGKLKHIKGSGNAKGNLQGAYTYTGTASY